MPTLFSIHVYIMDGNHFILPDRVGFPAWVYDNYKYPMVVAEDLSCENDQKEKKLFPHQEFVRNFLQPQNPFRGLLLYYGLGTGKTCASIGVADLYTHYNPPVTVLLPASLTNNYKKEVLECAEIGLLERPWSQVSIEAAATKQTIKALAQHLKVPDAWVKDLAKTKKYLLWPAPPTFFEPLGLPVKSYTPTKKTATATIECIMEHHYRFVHYNGLTKKLLTALEEKGNPFTDRLVVIDEAHNFISQVVNGSILAKKLYKLLMSAENCKIICLTGTPLINRPYELVYLLNMLRGEIRTFETGLLKGSKADKLSSEAIEKAARKLKINHLLYDVEMDLMDKKLWFSFTPRGYIHKSGQVVPDTEAWAHIESDTVLADQLHNELQKQFGVSKVLKTNVSYALPYEQKDFESLFLDPEHNAVKNPVLFQHRIQGTVAYFKSTGEKLLPSVLSSEVVKCTMSNHQFKYYQTVRDKERKMEKNGTGSRVYRAFSRMVCNFAFPNNLKRPYPHDLRKEMDLHEAAEDEAAPAAGAGEDAQLKKKQAAVLDNTMAKLVANAQEFLVQDLAVYSPKFAAVYEKLQQSPGTALLYTQFRTMEGIGIFREILKAHGYQAVDIVHSHNKWRFVEPLEPGKKRFVIFPEDRTKANVLLDLFNNRWDMVPAELLAEIPSTEIGNLRGEFAQLLMITQSGAEGLSLKNVRQVHILEPYWNQIRIDQVIGRAVRTCSHRELPTPERNLRVYTYVATLTPAQLKDAFTIRRMDKSLSSDEHIYMMARKKDELIQSFMDLLKASSVDCRIHAAQNQPTAPCFAPPLNALANSRMYHPQGVQKDHPDYVRDRMEKKQEVRGVDFQVETTPRGTKVVREVATGRMYDYQAFKFARNLVPVRRVSSPRSGSERSQSS